MGLANPCPRSAMWRRRRLARYLLYPGAEISRHERAFGEILVSSGLAIVSDLRLAIKSLGRTPGFTFIAIVTLGLGIGANTSMFSILNGYTLRPAPYADRNRLDRIYRTTRQERRGGISPADYLDLESQTSGYGEIAAYTATDLSLAEPGKPAEMADALRVSANLFSTLGARPHLPPRRRGPGQPPRPRHLAPVLAEPLRR